MNLCADTILFRLQILTGMGILMAQALGKAELASLLFSLTFVLTFGIWLVTAAGKISKRNGLALLILITSFVCVSLNALVTGAAVSLSYFRKLVMFWSSVLLLGTMAEYKPGKSDIRFVFRWNTILACFLGILYITHNDRMYLLNDRVSVYLTFRLTSPNLTAVFLSAVCMIELIHGALAKGLKKLAHTALAGGLVFFVFETRSRNAELLLMFFLLIHILLAVFPRWKPRMKAWMAVLIVLLPLAFALGYLLFVYTPSIQKLFSFLIGEGKDLDSRVEIWSFALRSFAASPLVGAYSQISGGTGASQMHNSHLDILASYGAPVLGMVCFFLFWVLYGKGALRGGRIHFLCQMGFAALLLSGIGEAMLFSGGMGIYLFAGILQMLSNYDFANEGTML